jgi:hypothetical protein
MQEASVPSRSPATTTIVAIAVLMFVAVACHRSDEDTAGGAATVSVPPSPTTTPTAATGNTGASGASGVSGSLGTSGASGASGSTTTANAVPVSAVEYEFRLDGGVPAGRDGFVLENDGRQPHELLVLQLDPGKSLADVQAAIENGVPDQPPAWVTPLGRTFAKPGATSKPLNLDVASDSTYVLACFVTTNKGVPHAALGMLEALPVASG